MNNVIYSIYCTVYTMHTSLYTIYFLVLYTIYIHILYTVYISITVYTYYIHMDLLVDHIDTQSVAAHREKRAHAPGVVSGVTRTNLTHIHQNNQRLAYK